MRWVKTLQNRSGPTLNTLAKHPKATAEQTNQASAASNKQRTHQLTPHSGSHPREDHQPTQSRSSGTSHPKAPPCVCRPGVSMKILNVSPGVFHEDFERVAHLDLQFPRSTAWVPRRSLLLPAKTTPHSAGGSGIASVRSVIWPIACAALCHTPARGRPRTQPHPTRRAHLRPYPTHRRSRVMDAAHSHHTLLRTNASGHDQAPSSSSRPLTHSPGRAGGPREAPASVMTCVSHSALCAGCRWPRGERAA